MPPRRAAWAIVGVAALAGPVRAERLNADQLRDEIVGNTLVGFNTSGVVFSEYHAPDGRVLGHNNGVTVVDGCWAVRGDAVCYHYNGHKPVPTRFCWHYDRAGSGGYRITSLDGRVTGAARLERGDTRRHAGEASPWVCESLVSQGRVPVSPVSYRRHRSR